MAPLLGGDLAAANGSSAEASHTLPKPRFLIIGAGSRGNAYARAVVESGLGTIDAVAEPIAFKRQLLGSKCIWHKSNPAPEQEFSHWRDFIKYEEQRRRDSHAGIPVRAGIDGVFVCVRDEQHVEVLTAIAPLGLHIMSEKPLATTLDDCLRIEQALNAFPERIFAIGHVLRYSPHNMLLRHLLLEQKVIGDCLSIEHTEPVGWWHFSHSYVRGNWRKESTTAPSLLTKSCHDIDFILWLLCSPSPGGNVEEPHLPARISSVGSLKQFRREQKPPAAGTATNCLSCPIKETCNFSAPRIYNDRHLAKGNARWPVDIVNPEVESILSSSGAQAAQKALLDSLAEDYTSHTPLSDIEDRPWYGRCVWESDNDVVDDQYVTIEWDSSTTNNIHQKAKTASFHMIAQTLAQCERRGRIYGTHGEIEYNSRSITVHTFAADSTSETTRTYHPEVPKNSHHGGGDQGLTQQFVTAVASVMAGRVSVADAQAEFLGCTVEEVARSHAAVFAAEEARREKKVVEWRDWWERRVETPGLLDG